MPSKCDLPMPGDVHFRYISFQSHKSRFLRVSVSVEMLSETGSRNLLGKDSCRPLHLPVGDAAIARGTAVGSGPDSSQNLSLTSHQQPPLGPRPRPMKHKSQETVPILWGPPKEAPGISCIHHWQCGHNWSPGAHMPGEEGLVLLPSPLLKLSICKPFALWNCMP